MDTNFNELVQLNQSGTATTTSRKIAEVFGKQHKDVLRAIQNLDCSQEFRERNFTLSQIEQEMPTGGKKLQPEYLISRDGFSFLVMGFTGAKASKFKEIFIEAFNKMEMALRNSTPALPTTIKEVAMLLLQSEEEKERILKAKDEAEQQLGQTQEVLKIQEGVIKQQAPKVEYHDKVLQSKTLYATTLIAKELGMGAISLNKQLHDLGIIHKVGEAWVLTYKYQNKGYTGTKTYIYKDSNGEEKTSMLTVWTEKGREFIHQVLAKYNNKTA